MNDKNKKYFKEKLIKEKEVALKILNNVSNKDTEFASGNIYYEELSNYDNHSADVGTEMFLKEQDEGFKNQIKSKIKNINESLFDLFKDNYGYCKSCNNLIEVERLEIIPYAKTCGKCLKEKEKNKQSKIYESINNEYLLSFSNIEYDLAYDREDAYQDVAQFDIVPGDPSYATGDYMGVFDENKNKDIIDNISQEYYENTLK